MKYIESINHSLHYLLDSSEDVYIIGEDILDPYGGAFRATKGLSSIYPDRVLTTPICEASITGMAIGMSLRGLKPIAEIMFGDFITLCADQIINHAAKFFAMYNGRINLPMVLRTPMGGGRGYGPTHSQSLEKLFMGVAYIEMLAPSIFHNVGKLLETAISRNLPVIFIENKLLYPEQLFLEDKDGITREEVINNDGYSDIVLKNYSNNMTPDVTIISYGGISRLIRNVMIKMIDEEIRILTVLPACISPVKQNTLNLFINSVKKSGKCLLIEEGAADFGWTAEVWASISEKMNSIKFRRLGALNTIIPAAKKLEHQVIVSEEKIIKNILEVLA